MSQYNISVDRLRQLISANLSGPILILLLFLIKVDYTEFDLKKTFRLIINALIILLIILTIITPNILDISYSTGANFEASGYGPNQMSSILGIGCSILFYCFIKNINIYNNRFFEILVFVLMLVRLIFTFSRGGLFTFIFVIVILFFS